MFRRLTPFVALALGLLVPTPADSVRRTGPTGLPAATPLARSAGLSGDALLGAEDDGEQGITDGSDGDESGAPPRAPRPATPAKPVGALRWSGPPSAYPTAIPASQRRSRGARELILTFDDGPDLGGTPAVLAELERRGLRAIFFVNGQHMVGSRPEDFARRDLVRKIAAQGHLVANHGLSHRNVCSEPDSIEHEIDGNAEIIAGATGLRPLLFRAPYGARCRRLDQALAERDLLSVGWNLDPQEWKGGSEDAIVDYVTSRLQRATGRAVLLLHDTKLQAVRALPRILDWVEAHNRRAVRLGGEPLVVRDYSVFLPPAPPLPETGLEPFGARVAEALGALPVAGTLTAWWGRTEQAVRGPVR